MRTIDADALKEAFDVAIFNDEDDYKKALRIIDNAQTVVKNEITLNLTPEERQQWLEKWSSALNGQCNITTSDTTTAISTKDKQKANALLNAYADGYVVGFDAGQKERPKGEWKLAEKDNQDIDIVCPFCNSIRFLAYSHGYTTEELEEQLIRQNLPNFCENCGADMRGDKKE